MTSLALSVSGLTKSYGSHRAVDDLTFEVPSGCLACLIGPNGAGKSTTMRTIAGLQVADAGDIDIAGARIDSPARAKQLCALTPQELSLFDHLTAEETLSLVGAVRGMNASDAADRAAHWFGITGLEHAKGRMVRTYSGGMKRKLAVACALLAEPPLVLLDESFTGLDPESTRALQSELRAYCDRGGSVLLSSHILDMVHAMADRVVVVREGRCVGQFDRNALDDMVPTQHETLTDLYLALTGATP